MANRPAQCSTGELVEELNRLFAEEVEASLRYLHLMSAIDPPRADVMALMQEAFTETIEHAQTISEKIRSLGGVVRMDVHLRCPDAPMSPEEVLAEALTFEEAAMEGYQELHDRLGAAGGQPADILAFIAEQVELEREHVEMLKRLPQA